MRLVLAILLLSGLAGCSSPDEAAAQPDPETTASVTTTSSSAVGADDATTPETVLPALDLLSCRNQGGVFSMPRDAAVAVLPEGFEPVAATSATSRPDSVVLYAIAVHCDSFAIAGVAGPALDFAYAELAVTPPADQSVEGIDDCTVPLAFIATDATVGAWLASQGLGVAGAGTLDELGTPVEAGGGALKQFVLGGASLEFIIGEAAANTLSVANGQFVLYGVQDGQVLSRLKGSAAGGAGHYAPVTFRAGGIPALAEAQGAALGFGASGFDLHFEPQAPAMA